MDELQLWECANCSIIYLHLVSEWVIGWVRVTLLSPMDDVSHGLDPYLSYVIIMISLQLILTFPLFVKYDYKTRQIACALLICHFYLPTQEILPIFWSVVVWGFMLSEYTTLPFYIVDNNYLILISEMSSSSFWMEHNSTFLCKKTTFEKNHVVGVGFSSNLGPGS